MYAITELAHTRCRTFWGREVPRHQITWVRPIFGVGIVPERSKGSDSSSDVFALVGSNPTDITGFFPFCFFSSFSPLAVRVALPLGAYLASSSGAALRPTSLTCVTCNPVLSRRLGGISSCLKFDIQVIRLIRHDMTLRTLKLSELVRSKQKEERRQMEAEEDDGTWVVSSTGVDKERIQENLKAIDTI